MEEPENQQVMSPTTGSFTLNQRRKLLKSPTKEDSDPGQEPLKVMANSGESSKDPQDPSQLQIVGQELVALDVMEAEMGKIASTTATPLEVAATPRTAKDLGSAEREGGFHSSSSQVVVWENGPQSMPLALKPVAPPLFSPEQLSQAEEMQKKAPMIFGTPERQRRPEFLKMEEQRLAIEGR